VFSVNHTVEKATLWWSGNDTIRQTPYGWKNVYFNDNVTNPDNALLFNGNLTLAVKIVGSPPRFEVTSTMGASTSTAEFLRINNEFPIFWADTAYVIYDGIVRDIVQQEPEYSGGVAGCPNFYSQVFLTLPANAPYYTYATRTIFVNSEQSRSVSDLSAIQLSGLSGTPLTEDGTDGGYPLNSNSTGLFYDSYPTGWDHHWSQISSGNTGAGLMFTDADNQNLYIFDTGDKSGALNVQSNSIEVNPVDPSLFPVAFMTPLDVTWHGAVVTFDGEPIYRSSGDFGLWVMVEHPPSVTVN